MLKPLTLALTLATTPLTAETDHCKDLGDMAAQIMEARQVGVPLSNMMEIVSDNDLLKALTLSAYQEPRYKSEEYKQEAVEDFRNEVEIICYGSGT